MRKQKITLLYLEMIFAESYTGQVKFEELLAYCRQFGYELYEFSPFLYTRTGRLWFANTIFLSPKAISTLESKFDK